MSALALGKHNVTMIGVVAKPSDQKAVEEFFQFFKTPWESFADDGHYDVVIVAGGEVPEADAKMLVVFDSNMSEFEPASGYF